MVYGSSCFMVHDQFIFHVQVKVEKDRETDPVLATQSGVNEVQGHESESEPEPEVWVNLYTSLFAIILHMPIFFIHCVHGSWLHLAGKNTG